jgi:hypothetical protein
VSIPDPPYLLEYRVARELMQSGNIGPSKLVGMLESGDAYFFEDDRKDFKSCPHCKGFIATHPDSFLKASVADMGLRGAVAAKLLESGALSPARISIANDTIKMVAVASRHGLKCVMAPYGVLWDNFAACDVAKVEAIKLEDFLADL